MISKTSHGNILKSMGWGLMTLLALLMFFQASRYLSLDPGVYFSEQRAVYTAHTTGLLTHIAGAMLTIIIGPFQFLPKSTTGRYLKLHRWLGRTYLLGVLAGGSGGLYMAFFAYGGMPARLGFAMLAVTWLLSGFMAYKRIRNREIQSHREWMIRCYALTLAAVTLRLWLAAFQTAGIDFVESYITVAWLSWVPNLMVAEWIVYRTRKNQHRSETAEN